MGWLRGSIVLQTYLEKGPGRAREATSVESSRAPAWQDAGLDEDWRETVRVLLLAA
jgi:hypothetical protein